MVWGYMLETKSADGICIVFKQFKAMVENEKPGYRIQRIRCDQEMVSKGLMFLGSGIDKLGDMIFHVRSGTFATTKIKNKDDNG